MTFRSCDPNRIGISDITTNLGLTQQASVRRGPRASATYLFTVSLAESEGSAFLANRVCVSPITVELTPPNRRYNRKLL